MWPFKKKPAPEAPRLPINEDWRAGDLAEMIDGGFWIGPKGERNVKGPEPGDVISVTGVCASNFYKGRPGWSLTFNPWPGAWYDCRAFRKVPTIGAQEQINFAAKIKRRAPARADA